MARLEFYQIYYKEEHLHEMFPFAQPFFNPGLTDYFENSVIVKLVPKSTADLIGVCSWALARKRGDVRRQLKGELTKERILDSDLDIMVLTPRSPSHQMLSMSKLWHGQAWIDAWNKMKELFKLPAEVNVPIYENHFITRREIYQDYVKTWLIPAIDFMEGKDVFKIDSGYVSKKGYDMESVREYQAKSGRNDWPIAPFILERLFSCYINNKGFKIGNV